MKLLNLLLILTATTFVSSLANAEMKKDEYKCDEAEALIIRKAQQYCENPWLNVAYVLGEKPYIGNKHAMMANGQMAEYCSAQVFFLCLPRTLNGCGRERFLSGELSRVVMKSANHVERSLARQELYKVNQSRSCFVDAKVNTEFDKRFHGEPAAIHQATVVPQNAAR